MAKAGFSLSKGDLTVDEDLPPFFEVIKIQDANQLIQENNTLKERYGFEIYE